MMKNVLKQTDSQGNEIKSGKLCYLKQRYFIVLEQFFSKVRKYKLNLSCGCNC